MKPPPFNQGVSLKDASPEERAWVDRELLRLQNMDAIREVVHSDYISKMFIVPKPDK